MTDRGADRFAVHLTTTPADKPVAVARPRRAEGPFCIALCGDFSGQSARVTGANQPAGSEAAGGSPRSTVRAIAVDRDDIEDVLARMEPAIELPLDASGEESLRITFRELDDFHPDRLYERLPLFRAMSELRDDLSRTTRGGTRPSGSAAGGARERAGPIRAEELLSGGGLLDRIAAATTLGGEGDAGPGSGTSGGAAGSGAADAAPASSSADPLDDFLARVVAPHLVREPGPERVAARERLDEAIAAGLRAVLHDPRFQRMEARWRVTDLLVRRLETGGDLKLFLVDVPGARDGDEDPLEAAADLLEQLLANAPPGTPEGTGWSLCVLDATVGPGTAGTRGFHRIAIAAATSGSAVLMGADTRLAGIPSPSSFDEPGEWVGPDPVWQTFRTLRAARSIGVVAPRFLLREPYGRATDPCDAFPLEEMTADPPAHGDYLWCNGAFAGALVLARAFADAGWRLEAALRPEIDGLPLHAIEDGTSTKPGAEAWMGDRSAQRMLDAGLMPLASVKHADRVHLVRVHSCADPLAPIAGPWTA